METTAIMETNVVEGTNGPSQELVKAAESNVEQILNFDSKDVEGQRNREISIGNLGLELQRESTRKSSFLSSTIGEMENNTSGGDVAGALNSLRGQVDKLNPNKMNLSAGFVQKLMTKVFGVNSPIDKYITKFRSSRSVIDEIVNDLDQGRITLERDNEELMGQRDQLRSVSFKLEDSITVGNLMDGKIENALTTQLKDDALKTTFVQQKLLFPLRQRIMDLSTQLAVTQQGIMTMDTLVDTNKILVQNVNRTMTVTVTALDIAVTLSKALDNQRRVLEATKAVNATTDSLIAGNASKLKNNAVDIVKQATESTLSIDTLAKAFEDINSAMTEIEDFKKDALPKMKDTIGKFGDLSKKAEVKIKEVEASKKLEVSSTLKLS